jgi:hypothetical protein
VKRVRVRNFQDIWSGLFFAVVAIAGLIVSRDYPLGTATDMGMGYVPRLLCWVLLLLGIIVMARGLAVDDEAIGAIGWRPAVLVAGAMVAFGLSIQRLGMVVATGLLVVLGSCAGRDVRYRELIVVTLVLTAMATLIFVRLLGVPVSIWPPIWPPIWP